MDILSDVTIVPCEKSRFIQPIRVEYCQDGKKKRWDCLNVQRGVLILIYNKSRDVLVFVKQLRPAVYANRATPTSTDTDGVTCIDHVTHPASQGMTLELCAGLVDKDKSLNEIARDEILEECGYNVPLECIQKLTEYRDDPDVTGVAHTIFYAEITDAMRVGPGGGNPEEGEFIEVIELTTSEAYDVIMNEEIQKPFSVPFAVLWFYRNIYKQNIKMDTLEK